jgi:hypothetical protein
MPKAEDSDEDKLARVYEEELKKLRHGDEK